MPARSADPTPAGSAPGLLRRAWRVGAAVASVVRAGMRRSRRVRIVGASAARMRAVVRLVWPTSMPWLGAMPPTGLDRAHLEPWIELECRRSRGRPWPLLVGLTRQTLCHGPSLNPLVWAGAGGLPVPDERHDTRPRLHADGTRNDHEPSRWRAVATIAPLARATRPPTARGWPPAQASPLPG
jgi:hypothetical protein